MTLLLDLMGSRGPGVAVWTEVLGTCPISCQSGVPQGSVVGPLPFPVRAGRLGGYTVPQQVKDG